MDNEAIKAAKEKFKNIAVIVDMYTTEIIYASDSMKELVGYSSEELIGQSIREFY